VWFVRSVARKLGTLPGTTQPLIGRRALNGPKGRVKGASVTRCTRFSHLLPSQALPTSFGDAPSAPCLQPDDPGRGGLVGGRIQRSGVQKRGKLSIPASGNTCQLSGHSKSRSTSHRAAGPGRGITRWGEPVKCPPSANVGIGGPSVLGCQPKTKQGSQTPRNRAKHSRHHTKDKQRFVVSVIAYDSLPRHQSYDFLRCSTTLYDAGPVRERNVARQLIDRSTLRWRSLVTWRGLHSQNERLWNGRLWRKADFG